jgi:imidazolonepropionase-like amidohydrolase
MSSPLLRRRAGSRRLNFSNGLVLAASALLSSVAAGQFAPTAVRAFTGVTLIDGTGRTPLNNATLLVENERITAVGPAAQIPIPANAERVAYAGKVIVPGLINAHGHASAIANLETYAAYGVTTVVSLGDETPAIFAARDAQRTRAPRHARVYLAGPVLNPTNPDEARAMVAADAEKKVDIVKIRVDDNLGTATKMSPAVYRAVIDEAHRRGMRVAVHFYYLDDAKALLAAGADFLAHSVRDLPVDAPFTQAVVAAKVCYSPTLMREVSTYIYGTTPTFFQDSQFLAHANREWMATLTQPARQEAMRTSSSAQRYRAQLPVAMQNLKALHAAGVPIAMGTDTGPMGRFQGFFELMEVEMMVEAGMTPMQALQSATSVAARCHHLDQELGTLERGKWADFIVLDASPLERIGNLRRQHAVYVGGVRVNGR